MSWILGITGERIDPEVISLVEKNIPQPLSRYHSPKFSIYAGGLKETCLTSSVKNNHQNWIVCGIGISPELDDRKHILSQKDWEEILSKPTLDLSSIEGHFTAILWNKDRITGRVDSRGVRDLYLLPWHNYLLFSTNLSWLSKICGNCRIDFARFGSKWLSYHQLSNESIINPIEKLGPGGVVEIKENRYKIHRPKEYFIPETKCDLASAIEVWSGFLFNQNYRVILLLSGGIDSRLLLSALLSKPRERWAVCVFGDYDRPDVKVALRIAKTLQLNHYHFGHEILDSQLCLKLMREFSTHNECCAPVLDAIRLNFYKSLYHPDWIVIDGGFGEILRRHFSHRLLLYHKFFSNPRQLIKSLYFTRADIFSDEITEEMEKGFFEDCINLSLFEKGKIDEAYLDLIAMKMCLPNRFGPEFVRLDGVVPTFSPFAQSTIFAAVLSTPLKLRRRENFPKDFIKRRVYVLSRFPLVKENEVYPFSLSSNKILLYSLAKIKRGLGSSFKDKTKIEILKGLEEFIRDTAKSRDTRNFAPYDFNKIERLITQFYNGKYQLADSLLWYLTFEFFRQECRFNY
uniref:Asparagine synthetase domain-containing protein n=1 Tax=candidate division WOR-3 bacterium TaxID=2052148 RepID=A0A7C4XE28_UNCW3